MVTLLPSGLCIVRVRLKSSASGIWLKTHIVESHKIFLYFVHWFVQLGLTTKLGSDGLLLSRHGLGWPDLVFRALACLVWSGLWERIESPFALP